MAEAKKTRKKGATKKADTTAESTPKVAEEKKRQVLTTGLEDYGRWRSIYKKHKRDPKEKPFRRGRIFC